MLSVSMYRTLHHSGHRREVSIRSRGGWQTICSVLRSPPEPHPTDWEVFRAMALEVLPCLYLG